MGGSIFNEKVGQFYLTINNLLTFLLPQITISLSIFQKAAKRRAAKKESKRKQKSVKTLGDNGRRFELVIGGYMTCSINGVEEKAPCRA